MRSCILHGSYKLGIHAFELTQKQKGCPDGMLHGSFAPRKHAQSRRFLYLHDVAHISALSNRFHTLKSEQERGNVCSGSATFHS